MFVEHKEVGEVQPHRERLPQPITKLSQAIREGAKLRPQCKSRYFSDYGESCALGAAAEAIYGANRMTFKTEQIDSLGALVPSHDFISQIIGKNDCGWSRERIADWLESQGL